MKRAAAWCLGLIFVGFGVGSCWKTHQLSLAQKAFETRASKAEAIAAVLTRLSDTWHHAADSLEKMGKKTDTLVETRERIVFQVDSVLPPPDTCKPNLIARDNLIRSLSLDRDTWRSAFEARTNEAKIVTEVRDTVVRTILSRPTPVTPSRWSGPSVGLGGFVGVTAAGKPTVGVGVSVTLLSWRL